VAWDVDREERIKRADKAVARKLVLDHKDKQLNEKKNDDIEKIPFPCVTRPDNRRISLRMIPCSVY